MAGDSIILGLGGREKAITEVQWMIATEDLSAGELVNVFNDGGTAKVRLANAFDQYWAHGFVVDDVAAGNSVNVFFEGFNSNLTGLTPAAMLYLSDTPGAVSEAPPASGNEQIVGMALNATTSTFESAQLFLGDITFGDIIANTISVTTLTVTGSVTLNNKLDDIAALDVTDGNIMVANGSTWVAESGATARTSLGLGTGDSPTFAGLTATGLLDVTRTGNSTIASFTGATNPNKLYVYSDGGGVGIFGNSSESLVGANFIYLTASGSFYDTPTGTAHAFRVNGSTVLSIATTSATIASTLTLASGSITDSTGAISFGNENLSTSGALGVSGLSTLGGDGSATALFINTGNATQSFMRFGNVANSAVYVGQISGAFRVQTSSADRYVIDTSGNHDFKSGSITTTGTLASGNATVASATPFMRVQDSDSAGTAAVPIFELYDSTSRIGYLGFTSAVTGHMSLVNSVANGDLNITTTGTGSIILSASGAGAIALQENTTVTGTLTVNSTAAASVTLNSTSASGHYLTFQKSGTPSFLVGAGSTLFTSGGAGVRLAAGEKFSISCGDASEKVTVDSSGNLIVGASVVSTSSNAQFYATKSSSLNADFFATYLKYTQSAASAGSFMALRAEANLTHTTGTSAQAYAGRFAVDASGSGGTTTLAFGVRSSVAVGAGHTVGTEYVYYGEATNTGTVTTPWMFYGATAIPSYLAGSLRIGTTSATSHGAELLHISRATSASSVRLAALTSTDSGGAYLQFANSTTTTASGKGLEIGIDSSENAVFYNRSATSMQFGTNDTERFRVASNAYALGIGTTSVASWASGYAAVQFHAASVMGESDTGGTDGLWVNSGAYYDGSWRYHKTGSEVAQIYMDGGAIQFRTQVSGTAAASFTWSEKMRLTNGGMLLVGDTANANMTVGLTLNQGANDDEILAFKSSDVAHGVTGVTETDTFGRFTKWTGAAGGMSSWGISEASTGWATTGVATTEDTGKTTTSVANIIMRARLISGASTTDHGAGANLFSIQNNNTTRFILDAEGDTWQTGSLTTGAPSGGTAAPWKLGTVAAVAPTSPDRTIEVEIGGTTFYLHAKTTND